jgi:hypothetical protein
MATILRQRRLSRMSAPSAAPQGEPRAAAREQFIPLRKSELVDTLARTLGIESQAAGAFRRFCLLFEGLVHRDYQCALERMKNAYAAFDPDADTRSSGTLSNVQLAERQEDLFREFSWLLVRGNFVRLAQADIDRALADRSQWGLNLAVDFRIFERLEVYCRGDIVGTRYRRRLRNRFRPEPVEVPIYQRLVVIFRLRPDCAVSKYLDTQDIHIKIFKDIPKVDLEMLLPGSKVQMSMVDRAKILLPTLSGLSIIVWKLLQGALLVAAAGAYGVLAFLGLVGGTIGYGLRSFYGYQNTKQKYQLNLTQSLYYQNLDNNAGAIYRLLDEAEEQENREAMAAYFYMWHHAPADGWSSDQLDRQIEAFLRAQAGQDVDFEVSDALDKLRRLKLIEFNRDGRWQAMEIGEAIHTLEARFAELPA